MNCMKWDSDLKLPIYWTFGKNYDAIRESTGVSAGTISQIKRAYQYGTGGYKLAIKRFQ